MLNGESHSSSTVLRAAQLWVLLVGRGLVVGEVPGGAHRCWSGGFNSVGQGGPKVSSGAPYSTTFSNTVSRAFTQEGRASAEDPSLHRERDTDTGRRLRPHRSQHAAS